jgi:hypothetical protein
MVLDASSKQATSIPDILMLHECHVAIRCVSKPSQLVLLLACFATLTDTAVALAQQAALGSDRSGVASAAVSSAAEALSTADASQRAVRGLQALVTAGVAHRQVS